MDKKTQVIEKATTRINRLLKVKEKLYTLSNDFLTDNNIEIYISDDTMVLVVSRDHATLREVLSYISRFEDKAFVITCQWSYGEDLFFLWKAIDSLIEIQYKCNHQDIPAKLLPSKTCKVVENIREEINYSIVCNNS